MGTLLFIITALFTLYSLFSFLYHLIRRQFIKAKRTLLFLGSVIGMYLIILLLVSFFSKSTILPLNQNKCFDEWCAEVVSISKIGESNNTTDYIVDIKVTNKGRGRPQRPDNPHIYAVDSNNKVYEQSQAALITYENVHGNQPSISQLIDAGSSFTTTMVFRLSKTTKNYLVITEGGWPTYFTIGDEGSFFHKESLTPLD